jgi:hypothetical protein
MLQNSSLLHFRILENQKKIRNNKAKHLFIQIQEISIVFFSSFNSLTFEQNKKY